jgi:hypothetical protein
LIASAEHAESLSTKLLIAPAMVAVVIVMRFVKNVLCGKSAMFGKTMTSILHLMMMTAPNVT